MSHGENKTIQHQITPGLFCSTLGCLTTFFKCLGLGFIFFVYSGFPLVAQEYTITESFFLPPVYFVGDQVEMRLVVRSRFADQMTIPSELPQPSWGRLEDIRIIERGLDRELRIRFVPFEPGTKTLPTLNLGPLVVDGLTVFVTSILTNRSERDVLEPIQGQMLLPGTQGLIILVLASLFLLPLGVAGFIKISKAVLSRVILYYREGRPFRRLSKVLRTLKSSADVLSGRDFYITLLSEIREYFSLRFSISAQSLTTRELQDVFIRFVSQQEDQKTLHKLFVHGDQVKFANLPSTITGRMNHLEQVDTIIQAIEIRERREQEKRRKELKTQRQKKRRLGIAGL
jgi:hypothetical protein